MRFVFLLATVAVASGCQPDSAWQQQATANRSSIRGHETVASPLGSGSKSDTRGDKESAYVAARNELIADPENADALISVAMELASQERYAEAAEVALKVSTCDVSDPVQALLFAFEWHLRGGDYEGAEADIRRAIALSPDDIRGHRTMAQLLSSQGRRFEARDHLLVLARQAAITTDELTSLIDLSGPLPLVSYAKWMDQSEPGLFDLGSARHLYFEDGEKAKALRIVDALVQSLGKTPVVESLRGRWIVEIGGEHETFEKWMRDLPPGTDRYPEYWLAIGLWLGRNGRDEEAVRSFGEALRLDPTDRSSLRGMSAALSRLGERERALRTQRNLATLDKIVRIAAKADIQQSVWIAKQMQALNRPWESVAWCQRALQLQGTLVGQAGELNRRRQMIRQWERNATPDQIRNLQLTSVVGFDIREFPLPRIETSFTKQDIEVVEPAPCELRFRDLAAKLGVQTRFVSDYSLDSDEFFLYQANGGGLAATDYDLDGRCDLYVVQSGGDPNQPNSSVPNQMYRCLPCGSFNDVSQLTRTDDGGYGQGVCAGDVNQDGFPDLLIANIGRNAVYINQGDGTFRKGSDLIPEEAEQWTSSLAIGDLDGDQLPDIVEVNYLDDPLIFERTCTGRKRDCAPQKFRAANDRIYRNTGDGTFRLWADAQQQGSLPNYGFGIFILNFDGHAGNDVFISNDGDLNHFWKSSLPEQALQGYVLSESAGISGCSVGASSDWEACMGIAAGDFDRNGLPDLLTTNFYNEPVNLYLQHDAGFFVDEAMKYGLSQLSQKMVGFGTQAADFDNDGWLDVAILNGHLYDARHADIPFRMVPQLLRGSPGRFSLQDHESAGPYWNLPKLGRTLALIDFNQDGRLDLVANHLDHPIALLQNDSVAQNWLQVELVGVASDRTAIGARIVVQAGNQRWTAWQTGGDGYMCSNENLIHVGIGNATQIDKIEIDWPSGERQVIESIEPNGRYLLIEGEQPVSREPAIDSETRNAG